jgi:alkyl sulfatase BDS1-like metallo-beta-lactamase superfamily hydrolase
MQQCLHFVYEYSIAKEQEQYSTVQYSTVQYSTVQYKCKYKYKYKYKSRTMEKASTSLLRNARLAAGKHFYTVLSSIKQPRGLRITAQLIVK